MLHDSHLELLYLFFRARELQICTEFKDVVAFILGFIYIYIMRDVLTRTPSELKFEDHHILSMQFDHRNCSFSSSMCTYESYNKLAKMENF